MQVDLYNSRKTVVVVDLTFSCIMLDIAWHLFFCQHFVNRIKTFIRVTYKSCFRVFAIELDH